jgi:hypothetical protein
VKSNLISILLALAAGAAALTCAHHLEHEPNLCARAQLAVHTLYQRAKFTPEWVPATPALALSYLERATCETPNATCADVERYVNALYEGALVGEVELSPAAVRELERLECTLCSQPGGLCAQLATEEVMPTP